MSPKIEKPGLGFYVPNKPRYDIKLNKKFKTLRNKNYLNSNNVTRSIRGRIRTSPTLPSVKPKLQAIYEDDEDEDDNDNDNESQIKVKKNSSSDRIKEDIIRQAISKSQKTSRSKSPKVSRISKMLNSISKLMNSVSNITKKKSSNTKLI